MAATSSPATNHTWNFIRAGGLDQVTLKTGADLANLRSLDPKLWVALACPVKGLEFDEKTLQLIDTDKDGRVRLPEIIAATDWALARLKDGDDLARGGGPLPLAAIDDRTPDGAVLLASAKQILAALGTPDAASISVAETSDTVKIFAKTRFNGDGIVPAEAAGDDATKQVIADILASVGSKTDRSGLPGVDQAAVDKFFAELAAFSEWSAKAPSATGPLPLGEKTAAALDALKAVRAKIDDFFNRGRLAAFDARATGHLNRAEAELAALGAKDLSTLGADIAALPIARVEAGRALPLAEGVNPAWSAALAALRESVVAPLLGATKVSLTEAEWADLKSRFAGYEGWLGAKAGTAVEKLGFARVSEILAGQAKAEIGKLLAKDLAVAGEMAAIDSVDRLARYYRDLARLLHNFVNFADFYDPAYPAIFQAGSLYLDSRTCDLCIRVDDPGSHLGLASLGKCYIAYCDLKRPGGEAMKVAAIFSNGDSDYLMVGRNGMFLDRKGRDWDATITKVVDNPISVRQAFWSPYKKFVRMIEEQVAKRAAAADSAADAKLAAAATATANADKSAKPAEPKKIDVGAVAAMGVAVGAIGGALGAIATGLAKLEWYQFPLVLLGLLLVISGPSMIIAWLKLRQRTLGPILEANGWAINGRVKINIPLGATFTLLPKLPANARRSLVDPFEDKEAAAQRRKLILLLVLIVFGAAAWYVRHDAEKHADAAGKARYFWQNRPPIVVAAPPAAASAPVEPAKDTSPAAKP